jgi:hypothetical protein
MDFRILDLLIENGVKKDKRSPRKICHLDFIKNLRNGENIINHIKHEVPNLINRWDHCLEG